MESKEYNLLRPEGGIGIGYARCFGPINVTLDATASYIREERNLGENTKARFKDSSCTFNVKGPKPENNLISPTARLTFSSSGTAALSFSFGYHGEFGKHFLENAGEAEFKFAF